MQFVNKLTFILFNHYSYNTDVNILDIRVSNIEFFGKRSNTPTQTRPDALMHARIHTHVRTHAIPVCVLAVALCLRVLIT